MTLTADENMDLIVAAARAARDKWDDPVAAAIAAQDKADALGVTLPSEDFCLHGHYNKPCVICDPIFS